MDNYWLVRLGKGNCYIEEALRDNFIGAGFLGDIDLTDKLPDEFRSFNQEMIPIYLKKHPEKTKVAAGLACGNLWVVAKGISRGDIVLSPQGDQKYAVAEVTGSYIYSPNTPLPHRREVKWHTTISRDDMSDALSNSARAIMTAFSLQKHAAEISRLIHSTSPIVSTDDTIEDPSVFAIEKHLEDFLVHNWKATELGKNYDIYEVDGELVGQQYPSDTGPIDILAISKDAAELLVIELKKGRASDVVVGQIQRYMGYVKDELAEDNQTVKGLIIGLEDDVRIRRALSVTQNIDFMRYKVSFSLQK